MPFSPEEAVLFGLDSDIGIHAANLEIARSLVLIRKNLEKNTNLLKTLTVAEFSRRTTLKCNFNKNVEHFATKHDRSHALHPFEGNCRVDLFILTCITLTETAHKSLEDNLFGPRFPEFCARIIGDFTISQKLRKRLISDVEAACQQHGSPERIALLGIGLDVEGPPSSVQAPLNPPAPVPSHRALAHPPKRKEYLLWRRDPAKPFDRICNAVHGIKESKPDLLVEQPSITTGDRD
ncbi:hypothetical protein B0I35DRAFT_182091 [Stachybotrys elegans]|uniref:Uncharacterized protein n=1 Tax=Stachybotrys elegans TaxID=80388 RepID=A0A8K0SB56_9HYPO|nr:hypothetical protein B0I35DRAFT_182091 [Stachybotrys elegans]